MAGTVGPGPVPVHVDDLPEGWEAFATEDADIYFSVPRLFYYCHELKRVQWERPDPDEARSPYTGPKLNGRKPFEKGDELIPSPPEALGDDPEGPFSDSKYCCSCEDPDDVYQPDEDMLEACLDCDLEKVKAALEDGADVELVNQPWRNSVLHLANSPPFWDAETLKIERRLRLELTQYLVRQNADLDVENIFHCKAIDMALFHGYQDTVDFLEAQGAKLGWFGAAYAGDLERVKELLDEGVDIDLKGRYNRTAFAEAHLRGQWRVESFLVQQGCCRALPHPEHMKFWPGAGSVPRGNTQPARERLYRREDAPEWYEDMMNKRYPGYRQKMALTE